MRIVIDMQGAQTESRFRGIGRYTMSFAQAVVRNRGEHEIILALNGLLPETIEPIRAAFDGVLSQKNIRVWKSPGPVRELEPGNDGRRTVAELVREAFLASFKADVIHLSSLFEGHLDNAVTSIGRFDRDTPVSVLMYDLIPFLIQDQYLKPNPQYAQYYLRKIEHLKKATHFLAISEYTRQELMANLVIPENRVVNVSTAIEKSFQPVAIDEETAVQLRRKFNLNRPFILHTGGGDERKNLPRLVEAFSALPPALRQGHQLLLTGKIPDGVVIRLQQQAKSAGLKPDELCLAGYVSDNELVQFYNLCKIYVFPSWHEGFGLPALEAMACGAPVIAANTSSLPEVVGLDEALFDPFDVHAITAAMQQVLEDEAFIERLRKNGLQRACLFSWDETARRAIAAWERPSIEGLKPSIGKFVGNRKPKLAFVSPLPPERTGIADYSAQLLPALAEHYDVEVVVTQNRVTDHWVQHHLKVRDVSWFTANRNEFDRILYQVGNSPFHQHMLALLSQIPGTVVLHDFFMSSLMAWLECQAGVSHAWTKALYASHGYPAVRERFRNVKTTKNLFPVNFDVLKNALGVIVHSKYSRQLAQQWYGEEVCQDWEVVPLVRTSFGSVDRASSRDRLGFDDNDFLICSFGFLDSTKLNDHLIDCWMNSALAKINNCYLIFVGENPGGDYGTGLVQTIRSSGLGHRIRITGFVSTEQYRSYLMAADVAVQLRTASRGETSAAVLDCMDYALPVIVNANGSAAELDGEAVWLLPDEFNDEMLIEALETLWRQPETRHALGERAGATIHHRHAPALCAQRYATAIERFYRRAEVAPPALIAAIADVQCFADSDGDIRHLAQDIADYLPLLQPARRLFLDVSATCRNDLKTGIQRVVRALVAELLQCPPSGFRVEPVYFGDQGGLKWHYRYARQWTAQLLDFPGGDLIDEPVDYAPGDLMVVVDFTGPFAVEGERSGAFQYLRDHGVGLHFVLYDLLPILLPDVFPPGQFGYSEWFKTVNHTADSVLCISRAVAGAFRHYTRNFQREGFRPIRIGWFHLGADIGSSKPSLGLPNDFEEKINIFGKKISFLMVGTIEPRKGHLQVLDAFDQLWKQGVDIQLIVVGNAGWSHLSDDLRRNIPETINRLCFHPELNSRLFWLEGISDEYLEKVYSASTCLIAASYGEGFGLPLIEAAQHNLPIIARDIPVFREVAGEHAFYFEGKTVSDFAQSVLAWLDLYAGCRHPKSDNMPWLTWKESAEQLLQCVLQDDVVNPKAG